MTQRLRCLYTIVLYCMVLGVSLQDKNCMQVCSFAAKTECGRSSASLPPKTKAGRTFRPSRWRDVCSAMHNGRMRQVVLFPHPARLFLTKDLEEV
jgi:hypothetical protein